MTTAAGVREFDHHPENQKNTEKKAKKYSIIILAPHQHLSDPRPGVSSGDWGRGGASHLQLREDSENVTGVRSRPLETVWSRV